MYIAHGTLLNVMPQPGWEESLGENGYISMYGWDPMLSTWNYHIVNLLYSNLKQNIFKNDKNKEGSGGMLIQQTIWI